MDIDYNNSIQQINPQNILISVIKNKKQPRLCIFNKVYPISLEIAGKSIFGIDMVYGKRYMKFAIENIEISQLIKSIDIRLMTLVDGLQSSFYGSNIIFTMLDKDIIIQNMDGKIMSSFSIDKNTEMEITLELGDIYTNNKQSSYKWIVKKIVIL